MTKYWRRKIGTSSLCKAALGWCRGTHSETLKGLTIAKVSPLSAVKPFGRSQELSMNEGASWAARAIGQRERLIHQTQGRDEKTLMKRTLQILTASASLLVAGMVYAGPPVEVTIKNLGTQPATMKLTTSNETSTYQIANPQPARTIDPGSSTFMRVQRVTSPDMNAAMIRYTIGGKTCAFGTTYQMRMLPGGIKQPQWTKTATPSGGATCTATIVSTAADYAWKVEFTMK